MTGEEGIRQRIVAVRERIAGAAARGGRDATEVTLVAATKTVPVEQVRGAVEAGVRDVGENRAQELLAKAPLLVEDAPRWHFLGALQRNKVKGLSPWVTLWHSVDREALGVAIARAAPAARVLVEVNLAGEPQKPGCRPEATSALVDALRSQGLVVAGLMAVPPAEEDPRPWFARLRDLARQLELTELSMGMTDDFEVAIEEGATIVRVGRALFGEREAGGVRR